MRIEVTDRDETALGQQALEVGFAACLAKPVKQHALYDTLCRILDIEIPGTPRTGLLLRDMAFSVTAAQRDRAFL